MLWLFIFMFILKYSTKIFAVIFLIAIVLKISGSCLPDFLIARLYRIFAPSSLPNSAPSTRFLLLFSALSLLVIASGGNLYLLLIFAGYPLTFVLRKRARLL